MFIVIHFTMKFKFEPQTSNLVSAGTRGNIWRLPKSLEFKFSTSCISAQTVMVIHLVVAEIYYSGRMWFDETTNTAIPRVPPQA